MARPMAERGSKGTGGSWCQGHPRQGRKLLPAASSFHETGLCSSGLARSNCGRLKWLWGGMRTGWADGDREGKQGLRECSSLHRWALEKGCAPCL